MLGMWNNLSLVVRICIGLVIGALFALIAPSAFKPIGLLGSLFVGALKAVAPILVLFLVPSAISQYESGQKSSIKPIISLYLVGTFLAALVAVFASFMFHVNISLVAAEQGLNPPQGITEVLKTILFKLVDNPVHAIANANYIGILVWGVLLGIALRKANETTKTVIGDVSDAVSYMVKLVIQFAPFGIMGLVFNSVSTSGLSSLLQYAQLLILLLGCMFFVALVVNPAIAFFMIKENPYPLVFKCLRRSGITAFFTRSSAANIPVNMDLCEELKLNKDIYSVSIPLGATVNMAGAAITISVLTLAAVNTLGIEVDFATALILSILSAVSACGASGVAGGSLLLIPLACSLFGISNDVAMQVVGVGFIIGVIQDAVETALNSSTDVLFTAISDAQWRNNGAEPVVIEVD